MKNKFIFFLTVCLFININYYDIKAEEFIFESQTIEITNNGNKIQAKDGVKVSTTNHIEITANESIYEKQNIAKAYLDAELYEDAFIIYLDVLYTIIFDLAHIC